MVLYATRLARSRRGQFYVISCITILMALLVMESMIREHRPLKRDNFSLMPLLFFQNSRQQGLKVAAAACTESSPQDTVCRELVSTSLDDYAFFMGRSANELGYAWDGEVTYATDASWDIGGRALEVRPYVYRIPVEIESNHAIKGMDVSKVVLLPLETDFDIRRAPIWMVRSDGGSKEQGVYFEVVCTASSGGVRSNAYGPIPECLNSTSWRANFTWHVTDLEPFHPQRFFIYFNATGAEVS